MGIDKSLVQEIIRRILSVLQPERIIIFGSAASGDAESSSDLDLLVIMSDGTHRRRTAQTIYRVLCGLGVAKDVVVVTESDVRQYSNAPSLVLYPALREGIELYHAA